MIEHGRLGELWGRVFTGSRSIGSFIAGQVSEGRGDEVVLVDPASEARLATYRDAGADLAAQAAGSGARGAAAWQAMNASARGRVMWNIAAAIRRNGAVLAEMEAITVGMPIRDARDAVEHAAETFEYYAGWCDKLDGDLLPVASAQLNYVRREAYGVVLAITPSHAPLASAGWNVAPALAAGNAVVLKPPASAPMSSLLLARLALDAGLPERTLNVVAGLGVVSGEAALRSPNVRKICFTGSVNTGRVVARVAGELLKPCLLALGGKSANIVFADADIDRALNGAVAASFAAAGQNSAAGSRLLVERPIYDRFVARLVEASRRLVVGMPSAPETEIGPLATAAQFRRVGDLVAVGRKEGAELVLGGTRPEAFAKGYFFAPTILAQATNAMRVAREEIFGPVVAAIPFDGEEEAVALANDTSFGLAGAAWTSDAARGHRLAARVHAGTFWLNGFGAVHPMSPFGGFRNSGHGRSSGREALLEYTQTKSVWVEAATEAPPGFAKAS